MSDFCTSILVSLADTNKRKLKKEITSNSKILLVKAFFVVVYKIVINLHLTKQLYLLKEYYAEL